MQQKRILAIATIVAAVLMLTVAVMPAMQDNDGMQGTTAVSNAIGDETDTSSLSITDFGSDIKDLGSAMIGFIGGSFSTTVPTSVVTDKTLTLTNTKTIASGETLILGSTALVSGTDEVDFQVSGDAHGNLVFASGSTLFIAGSFKLVGTNNSLNVITLQAGSVIDFYGLKYTVPAEKTVTIDMNKSLTVTITPVITLGATTIDFSIATKAVMDNGASLTINGNKAVAGSDPLIDFSIKANYTTAIVDAFKILADKTVTDKSAAIATIEADYAKCSLDVTLAGKAASAYCQSLDANVNNLAYSLALKYAVPADPKSTDNVLTFTASASFDAAAYGTAATGDATGSLKASASLNVSNADFKQYADSSFEGVPTFNGKFDLTASANVKNTVDDYTLEVKDLKISADLNNNYTKDTLTLSNLSVSVGKVDYISGGTDATTKDDDSQYTFSNVSLAISGKAPVKYFVDVFSGFTTSEHGIDAVLDAVNYMYNNMSSSPDVNLTVTMKAGSVYVKTYTKDSDKDTNDDGSKCESVTVTTDTVNASNFNVKLTGVVGNQAETVGGADVAATIGLDSFSFNKTETETTDTKTEDIVTKNEVDTTTTTVNVSNVKIAATVSSTDLYELLGLISEGNETYLNATVDATIGSVSYSQNESGTDKYYDNTGQTLTTTLTDETNTKVTVSNVSVKANAIIDVDSPEINVVLNDGSTGQASLSIGSISANYDKTNKTIIDDETVYGYSTVVSANANVTLKVRGEFDFKFGVKSFSLSSFSLSSASLSGDISADYKHTDLVTSEVTRSISGAVNGISVTASNLREKTEFDDDDNLIITLDGVLDASVSSANLKYFMDEDSEGYAVSVPKSLSIFSQNGSASVSINDVSAHLVAEDLDVSEPSINEIGDGSYVKVGSASGYAMLEIFGGKFSVSNATVNIASTSIGSDISISIGSFSVAATVYQGHPMDKFNVSASNLKIDSNEATKKNTVTADSLSGNIKPIGYNGGSFSLSDFKMIVGNSNLYKNVTVLELKSGKMTMDGTMLDQSLSKKFSIVVDSGTELTLKNSPVLYSLTVNDGATVSGTAVFGEPYSAKDGSHWVNRQVLSYDGTAIYFDQNCGDFKMSATFDKTLALTLTPTGGYSKIAAKTGGDMNYDINEDGTATVTFVSDAGEQTLLANGDANAVKTYKFVYGNTSEDKKYGETVTISAPAPASIPEGYTFIGWNDGRELIKNTGLGYTFAMPARDVTVTDVFYKEYTGTSDIKLNDAKDTFVLDATSGSMIIIDNAYIEKMIDCLDDEGYENVAYVEIQLADNVSIRLDVSELDYMDDYSNITMFNLSATEFGKEAVNNVAAGQTVLSINVTHDGTSNAYSFRSMVTVTIPYTLKTGENAADIKVCWMDYYGHLVAYDTTFEKTGTEGQVILTFETDHFSNWMPTIPAKQDDYSNGGNGGSSDNTMLYIVAGAAAVVVIAGAAFFLLRKH